jgi:protein-disulfide isomerase
MKKVITISIIVLLALGLGYYLFKISPDTQTQSANWVKDFNLSGIDKMELPSAPKADDHILGNPEAKNVLVAYEDLQCPACKTFDLTFKQLSAALTDTQVIFRHLPLNVFSASRHPNSIPAAYALEAANAQGKLWEYESILYSKQQDWENSADPLPKFAEYARDIGVTNIDQFNSDINSRKYKDRIERDVREAIALNVSGTPTVYFNGKKIEASASVENIKKQVEPLYVK